MFDYDKWQEIINTIKKNKLRTFLTMFGVFWGIFMLILLLGSGNGLENGAKQGFSGWATNSGFVWTQRTTMPYKGFKPGRFIQFVNQDAHILKQNVEGLEHLAPRNQLGGFMGGNNVSRNNKTGAFTVNGDYPEYYYVKKVDLVQGRYMNQIDIREKRKIAIIGEKVMEILFEKNEDPIEQYIKINGVYFKVVGVFKTSATGGEAERDAQTIFVPFTTFQQSFNFGDQIGWFGFTAKEGYKVVDVETAMVEVLKKRHNIHPEDLNALGSANLQEEFDQFNGLFNGIAIFVWIVGIGTLMAGVIGVSNIMLIIVKERTKEIGIRKSLGATPYSIVSLIMQESIFITAFAGYIGLLLATLLVEGGGYLISQQEGGTLGIFGAPEVNFKVAIAALITLVVCGALAGLIPARKAAKISPIEAIRQD